MADKEDKRFETGCAIALLVVVISVIWLINDWRSYLITLAALAIIIVIVGVINGIYHLVTRKERARQREITLEKEESARRKIEDFESRQKKERFTQI